jgi:hypothetical protein
MEPKSDFHEALGNIRGWFGANKQGQTMETLLAALAAVSSCKSHGIQKSGPTGRPHFPAAARNAFRDFVTPQDGHHQKKTGDHA